VIVDASVILRAFFPDEEQPQAQALIRDHVSRQVRLLAPTLLLYELSNAVLQAVCRARITWEQGEAILASFEGLGIEVEPVSWGQMMSLARQFDRSAYDAAYLALAEARGQPLITGDRRLYQAVHPHLQWVEWIGNYPAAG